MLTSKNLLLLPLCIAFLTTTAFYLLLTAAGDGHLSIPEPDQVLYMQYARNMATGHPYVFSPGDAPSSGSTTHLYILILAALYRCGATGEAFYVASYVLNALLYLGTISMVWLIVRRINPKALPLAMLLTVLSGHTASAALKQTDIGFFMFLALALLAAIIHGRHGWAIALTMLCAASRPEGFIFSVAFLMCGVAGYLLERVSRRALVSQKQALWFIACGVAGIAVFFITLLINYMTTGEVQFQSVANKGYFKVYPFNGALYHTLQDALSLIKGVFFGLHETYRQYYLFPALSGILGIGGIMLYRREDIKIRLCECWLAIVVPTALLLIASSQYQGISNDRYLGWIMLVWIIYIALGWDAISNQIRAPHFRSICAALMLLYQLPSILYLAGTSYTAAVSMEHQRKLGEIIASRFDPSVRFGSLVGGGMNYFMPRHKVYNLHGITSPDFYVKGGQQIEHNIELLKHKPELRFDYWLTSAKVLESCEWVSPFVSELVMEDMETSLTSKSAMGIYRSKWQTLDGGNVPRLVDPSIAHLTLVDRIDIGYLAEEQQHRYECRLRLKNTALPLFAKTDTLGNADYTETGRIVMGSESFNIGNVQSGKKLVIVLRTGIDASGKIFFGQQYSSINKLELNDQIAFRLFMGDNEIPCPTVALQKEGFSEIVFEVPAEYVTDANPRITLVGDHISYAFWFYQ